jgi:hypothetical protein
MEMDLIFALRKGLQHDLICEDCNKCEFERLKVMSIDITHQLPHEAKYTAGT